MPPPSISNSGAFITSRVCGLTTATAAGTGDNTAVTGSTIDRQGFGSGKAIVSWKTTLTADKTLSIAAEYQDSADGTTWATAVALQASTVVKTGAATNAVGEEEWNIDFSGLGRYIRINFTPDLSHTSTDTAVAACTLVLGGADKLPAA
jgi:hypothetical protein